MSNIDKMIKLINESTDKDVVIKYYDGEYIVECSGCSSFGEELEEAVLNIMSELIINDIR